MAGRLLGFALLCFVPFALAQKTGKSVTAPGVPASALTVIYKLVDESGHVTYSNLPMKGATKLELEPVMTLPLPGTAQAPVTSLSMAAPVFPATDALTQKKRDEVRRKILEDELGAEKKLLSDAKSALQGEEGNREVIRMMQAAAEKQSAAATVEARRAFDLREEKLRAMQETIITHEKNVEAIGIELAALK